MSRFALVKESVGGGKTEQLIKTAVSVARLEKKVLYISVDEPDTLALRIVRANPNVEPRYLVLRQYEKNIKFSSVLRMIDGTQFDTLIVDNAHMINAGGVGYEDNLKKVLFELMSINTNTMVSVNIIRSK
jgi:hypothetical protein